MQNWFVQQLRFSAFVPAGSPELLSTVWPLISSEPPDSDESRPREGFRRMVVPETDSIFEVVCQPGRFDVVKSAFPGQAEIQPVVHFGEAEAQIAAFADRVRSLLDGLDESVRFQRVAFGVFLVRPVESRNLAYEELGRLLPVQPDPARSRDFLYQINYPETFSFGGGTVELNRLCRWSAMRTQQFTLQVAPNEAGDPTPARTGLSAAENFVRCEIDNSSAADNVDGLPREALLPIFSRLIELAFVTADGERHEAS